MDGMLSQDEINALLSGMDLSNDSSGSTASDSVNDSELLTDMEKDAIGEVANISMGTSATTLYSLVNRKVSITTPVVTLASWEEVAVNYEKPCVFIQIRYTSGLDGTNILVLKENDVKIITDLMMGGDGTNTSDELGELHLSAISEAMNQMMGSAATSLSSMLGNLIDISPPEANLISLQEAQNGGEIAEFLQGTFVKISFKMQIDDLVDSSIMQLYPIDFAKSLVETFINQQTGGSSKASEPKPYVPPVAAEAPAAPMQNYGMPMQGNGMPQMGMPGAMQTGMPQGMTGMPGMQYMPGMGMPGMQYAPDMGMQYAQNMGMPQMGGGQNVNIQPAQFQNFSNNYQNMVSQENIGLIKDVPLEVTVELGRTSKSISEILEFAPGTIIELDKIAGEPIDVLVNGKFVARGEVVVIEESFGVRVTEIIK